MLAKKAGVSVKTIQRALNEIDDLKYVGSGYSGHWEKTGAENVPQDVAQDVPHNVPQDVPHQPNDSISYIEKEIKLNNNILRQLAAEKVDLEHVDNGNDDCLGKAMVENDTQDDTQGDTEDDTQDDTQEKIIRMIQTNPKVSTADIAKKLGVGIATVKRKFKNYQMYHM